MMTIEQKIRTAVEAAASKCFGDGPSADSVAINETKPEFAGEFTVVTFPLTRFSKSSPEATGEAIGAELLEQLDEVKGFNVIKGFLNLEISDAYWLQFLAEAAVNERYGFKDSGGRKIVLEYVGPNTNKPLHLGHIRNMLLGYSVAEILKACGHDVHKVNIYNDRGIAICKSQVAWQRLAGGATPESTGIKGDLFVGNYYVEFDRLLKEEMAELQAGGMSEEEAKKKAPIQLEAQETLRKWEEGDEEVISTWKMMNGWVYEGFQQTFDEIGIDFEKAYYESEHYLDGKQMAEKGLAEGHFEQDSDGSVWVNLEDRGLDRKILTRADGTSVYITQDMGVARARYEDYQMDQSIYVVGNEQDYHFKVLRETLSKMGAPYAEGIFHLSYGMVNLPGGAKLKSREGTRVDADDLVRQMYESAREQSEAAGKSVEMSEEERNALYKLIGLGALKFFILRVQPKKNILFDPQESIDLHGYTGVFIQYAYTRTQSILRKAKESGVDSGEWNALDALEEAEKALIMHFSKLPAAIEEAGAEYDPSSVADYAYELAKTFNRFYDELSILSEKDEARRALRIALVETTARIIKQTMALLGIQVPERM